MMQENKGNLILLLSIIAIFIFTGVICSIVKQANVKGTEQKEKVQTEISVRPGIVTPKEVGAGTVGETKETFEGEEIVILPAELGGPPRVLPPAIFNGSGQIKEITKDSLIIEGTGYNFADQKPRDLTLKFSENAITNAQDGTKRIGFEGLTRLEVGSSITFESLENIRGKTEFEVTYVNEL